VIDEGPSFLATTTGPYRSPMLAVRRQLAVGQMRVTRETTAVISYSPRTPRDWASRCPPARARARIRSMPRPVAVEHERIVGIRTMGDSDIHGSQVLRVAGSRGSMFSRFTN
jgi:hypothetical protein